MRKLLSGKSTDGEINKPDHELTYSTPRWVKVFGIIVIVLVLFVVILHLTGNSPGGPDSHTPPSGVLKQGEK